jgi:hypothetical protein
MQTQPTSFTNFAKAIELYPKLALANLTVYSVTGYTKLVFATDELRNALTDAEFRHVMSEAISLLYTNTPTDYYVAIGTFSENTTISELEAWLHPAPTQKAILEDIIENLDFSKN